ncbi:MAG: TIM barrel protein [Actinomycetota bacterium]
MSAVDTLVLSHFSLRYASFEERVAAAAAAGIDAIGLFVVEYAQLRRERSVTELRSVLDRHGVRLLEIEVLRPWATDEASAERLGGFVDHVLEMADELGADHLMVTGDRTDDFEADVDTLGRFVDRLAPHGVRACLEFLPFTNIPDADSAAALCAAVDRPNLGICADNWHHERGANDLDQIRRAAPWVNLIQLDDGPAEPVLDDYKQDCLEYRVPPGEGDFDVEGFLRVLFEEGVDTPVSIEVISTELQALPHDEAARKIVDGTRAVLARSRA